MVIFGTEKMGIKEVFGPGTTTAQVVSCVQDLVKDKGQPPRGNNLHHERSRRSERTFSF